MRRPVGIGGSKQARQRVVPKVQARAIDWRIDDRDALDAFLAQGAVHRRLDGEMTTAEWTMQATKEANKQRLLTAKVVNGYLPCCEIASSTTFGAGSPGCNKRSDISPIRSMLAILSLHTALVAPTRLPVSATACSPVVFRSARTPRATQPATNFDEGPAMLLQLIAIGFCSPKSG